MMRSKRRGNKSRTDSDILSRLRAEFDALDGHLEIAMSQWRRARETMSNPDGAMIKTSDLYDALRMRCVWIQERIQAVHQIHGSFWRDFRQELALEMKPIQAALANGHQIDNRELDLLANRVVKPLHDAVKRTRFAVPQPHAGVVSTTVDRETLMDCLGEVTAGAETPTRSGGFTMVSMHEGEPWIIRVWPEVDPDGVTRRIAVTSSRSIDGRLPILGKPLGTTARPSDK